MNNHNYEFKYYSSGSYGILIKNSSDDFIYKITEFSDYIYIFGNNFNEMIYLNYFKNKYFDLYENKNNNLPIQNISTNVFLFSYFIKLYKIDNDLVNKIIKKLGISLGDLIIVNKMKFYPYNLYELNKRELNKREVNINNLYLELEKIILCLYFFHSNGLAHGDLKLFNIVSDKNDYRIIDFGGIKHKLNPKYECTCTLTYRAPEDFEFEYKLKHQLNDLENNKIYLGCPLKSDIWSLGLIFNELVNKLNPIQNKYNDLVIFNNNIDTNDIEKKIYLYLKKTKNINLISNINSLFVNKNNDNNMFYIYKINKIIEKMLIFNPDERANLNEIYLNLFYQELPNLEKYNRYFEYNIKSKNYFDKFINFRNYYYPHVKINLKNTNEIFLYPFIINLLDRLIIVVINIYLTEQINLKNKFNFVIELINLINLKQNNMNNINFVKCIYYVNICYYSIYIISKLIILKKNINVTKNIYDLNIFFSICVEKIITINDIMFVYEYILQILEILNYDVVRTKLFLYQNTPIEIINKFIEILESFNVGEIIKYIE